MPSVPKFLLDENVSWRVARGLVRAGYDVVTAQALGLGGAPDHKVFREAQQQQRAIITRDSDFLKNFAPPHQGVIVLQFSDDATNTTILDQLVAVLPNLVKQDLTDTVNVITPTF